MGFLCLIKDNKGRQAIFNLDLVGAVENGVRVVDAPLGVAGTVGNAPPGKVEVPACVVILIGAGGSREVVMDMTAEQFGEQANEKIQAYQRQMALSMPGGLPGRH